MYPFPTGSIAAPSLEEEHPEERPLSPPEATKVKDEENSALTCRITVVDVALLEARALASFLVDSHCSTSRVKGSIFLHSALQVVELFHPLF